MPPVKLSLRLFSFVEFFVISAILMIILSLFGPSVTHTLDFSKRISCAGIQRQFSSSLTIYAEDADGFFVPVRGPRYWSTAWPNNIVFRELLGMTDHSDTSKFDEPLNCPTVDPNAAGSIMRPNVYGFNREGHGFYNDKPTMFHRYKVNRPSNIIQMTEGTDWHLVAGFANYEARWDVHGQFRLWQVAYRHDEGAQSVFFDGHVEFRHKEDMWFENREQRDAIWRINSDAGYLRY